MNHLSLDAKEAIVLKALNRGSETLESLARSNNVGLSTLQKWLRHYREGKPFGRSVEGKAAAIGITHAERFNHVLATASLDDVSLGQYCRAHGLYSHQLSDWRSSFMKTPKENKQPQQSSELKKLKDENQRLQRELRRKDKALAEASALLVMKKKAELIWGVDEDD